MPAAPAPSNLGSPPARSRDHPIEVATRIELVKMAFVELAGGTVASTCAVIAFTLALATRYATLRLWCWTGAMVAIALYRFWLASRFKQRNPPPAEYSQWAFRLVIATTATALGWGLSVWIFPTLTSGGRLGVAHVLILAGMTTGATRMLLPLRKGSIAYLMAMMGPLALRFFAQVDLVGATLGACTTFFVIYMRHAMLRNQRMLFDALVLRFEREALAAELTAENARRKSREAELRDAREKAESASRAKGEFLATMSHEIRTPMNGVLGMLRIVQDTPLTPEQREYIRTASDSAESLLLLLNDILDFSKIEAGRLELEHASFSPAEVIRGVSDLMRARAADKGLQFEERIDDAPPIITGDAARLRQIVVNLAGNAIKFTAKGRVELKVSCVNRATDRMVLNIAVTDTGIGIDSAVIDRLFKPFSQADTSMSRRYGGTGLGLAISQRIAHAMGGSIEVQSEVGRGSTFQLILPCTVPAETTAPAAASNPPFVVPSLRGRVLVVEDDAVNKQVIDLFLKKLDLTPAFASDGEAAIAVATKDRFDVVLMDCQLPGIDGLEATRRIRKQLGSRPLRIIALTANANTHVRDACLAAGMNDFLSKPVRFELLADVLKRNLPN